MPPIETLAIQQFMDKVKRAAQGRSRELRLEIGDATILAAEIGSLLSRLATLESNRPITASAAKMDGGSLR
jgi:hypothetical protein